MNNAAERPRALLGEKLCPACGEEMNIICIPCTKKFPQRKNSQQMSAEETYRELDTLIGSRNLVGNYLPIEKHCQRVRELTGLEATDKEIICNPKEIFKQYLQIRQAS